MSLLHTLELPYRHTPNTKMDFDLFQEKQQSVLRKFLGVSYPKFFCRRNSRLANLGTLEKEEGEIVEGGKAGMKDPPRPGRAMDRQKGERTMQKQINLQDRLLDRLREERQVVMLFTTNGFQMKGRVAGFDGFVIVLEIRGEQQIVYRHAVSTITPDRPIDLDSLREEAWR